MEYAERSLVGTLITQHRRERYGNRHDQSFLHKSKSDFIGNRIGKWNVSNQYDQQIFTGLH